MQESEMIKKYNPESIVGPFSQYSQGAEAPAGTRWLYIAGQVGANPDGSIAKGAEAQVKRAWLNLIAVLESAGMGVEDLVKINTYITRPEDVELNRRIRDRMLKSDGPAVTMVTVAALSHPEWLVEIEGVAAKA
ncbi:MAG: RidA family protein [Acidiferrobacterales bacterium]